ncbi:MAG: zinc-ribbon domain-containing protein [Bacteroidota bacterium]
MKCTKCGTEFKDDAKYCPECGTFASSKVEKTNDAQGAAQGAGVIISIIMIIIAISAMVTMCQ